MRNRIIETLCSYKGLRIVQTRLCVAMASIVIHSIPAQWKTPVLEIISLFRGNSTLLFEVLTVVPEEFSTQASKNHYFYSIYFFIYFSVFHPYLILIVFCVIFFFILVNKFGLIFSAINKTIIGSPRVVR